MTNHTRRHHRRIRWLIGLEYRTTIDQLKEDINSINITLSTEMLDEITNIHLSDPNPCL